MFSQAVFTSVIEGGGRYVSVDVCNILGLTRDAIDTSVS